jgi:small multidrug resistance pump
VKKGREKGSGKGVTKNKRRPDILQYGYLLIAVALEVSGTMLLPVSQNFTRPVPTLSLIGCYAASFYCLTFALNTLPIAVVYATWSGLGIFLITLFGYLVFEQALDWRAILGLLLIVAGVVLVNSFAPHK